MPRQGAPTAWNRIERGTHACRADVHRPAKQRGLKPEASDAEERRHIRSRMCGLCQPESRRRSEDDAEVVDRDDQRLRVRLVAERRELGYDRNVGLAELFAADRRAFIRGMLARIRGDCMNRRDARFNPATRMRDPYEQCEEPHPERDAGYALALLTEWPKHALSIYLLFCLTTHTTRPTTARTSRIGTNSPPYPPIRPAP